MSQGVEGYAQRAADEHRGGMVAHYKVLDLGVQFLVQLCEFYYK